jgi:hypothetical protein
MNTDIQVSRKRLEITAIPEFKKIQSEHIPHLLKEGEVGMVIDWVLKDTKTGEIIPGSYGVKKGESFVRQFLEFLWIFTQQCERSNAYVLNDITNTLNAVYIHSKHFDAVGAAAAVNKGIIIGTGVVAPNINDYAIGTIIPHATMNYGGVTFGAPASDATVSQFTITRNFANVSGGPVTVQEVALYVRAEAIYGGDRYFMMSRDLTGGIVVPNGVTLTMNCRIQATI